MTKRENVITSLLHKECDVIPYNITFTKPMSEKMAVYFNDEKFEDRLNNHFCTFTMWKFVEVEKDIFRDETGVLWNKSIDKDIGIVCNNLIPVLSNRTYKIPKLDRDFVHEGIQWLQENKADKFCLFDVGFTLYERAWTLCGVENLLIEMVDDPKAVHGLLEEISDYLSEALDIVLEYDFIDGVLFGDDWGSQRGLVMGKARWAEFFKPYFRNLYGKVKASGKFVFHHSCGFIEDIFPELIEIGLDCYQTFQPEVYNIEKVKAEYGKDLSFWGGISTQRLLPHASAEKVASETSRILGIMGAGGGYIAAPTHDVPGDVPVENLIAMWNVFENQTSTGI